MSEESHDEFMRRIRAMSSAQHRSASERATIVGSASSSPQVASGVRKGQSNGKRKARPLAVKAGQMAAKGYGWEDIALHCKMDRERARRIVFRKQNPWNAWMFGKREARS